MLHVANMGHAVVQLPQCIGSVAVFTHVDPHIVVPVGQLATHRPREQSCPAAHATPHAPQFIGSLATFTHAPPQSI
jgi:hypothetical protein